MTAVNRRGCEAKENDFTFIKVSPQEICKQILFGFYYFFKESHLNHITFKNVIIFYN